MFPLTFIIQILQYVGAFLLPGNIHPNRSRSLFSLFPGPDLPGTKGFDQQRIEGIKDPEK